ncbi:MGH1-like glycoside hydrolase domain-containing protein [Fulvitalea axinellae]
MKIRKIFYGLMLGATALACQPKAETEKVAQAWPETLPDVWGGKQLFTFSGLDGTTDYDQPFSCFTLADRLGIRLANFDPYLANLSEEQILARRPLWVELEVNGKRMSFLPGHSKTGAFEYQKNEIVSSSLIRSTVGGQGVELRLELAFADQRHIAGRLAVRSTDGKAKNVTVTLRNANMGSSRIDGKTLRIAGEKSVSNLRLDAESVKMKSDGIDWPVSLDGEAMQTAPFSWSLHFGGYDNPVTSVSPEFDSLVAVRVAPYLNAELPKGISNKVAKTYLKAYSMMRGNTETAQGMIPFTWTSPDRSPHRQMWLWDSGFHGMGLKFFDGDWAMDALKSVLACQREDGFVSHAMNPKNKSNITQPPVLAWAVWDVYETTKSKEFLEYSYGPLKAYLRWMCDNRDENKNGLLEWYDGNESGMDNSPRFDEHHKSHKPFDAVDFNCFMANDYLYLEKIAKALGKSEEASEIKAKRDGMVKLINEKLWDETQGFYMDRYLDGTFLKVKAISNFLPLYAKVATPERAKPLVKALGDSSTWFTALPGPSVALDDATFGSNMWRGPVWINYSYMNYLGLKNYGADDLAKAWATRTVENMADLYMEHGTIFEFYDPLMKTSPRQLPRKSALGCLTEFGWSSMLYVRMVEDLAKESGNI